MDIHFEHSKSAHYINSQLYITLYIIHIIHTYTCHFTSPLPVPIILPNFATFDKPSPVVEYL